MSVAVSQPSRPGRPASARESLGDTMAIARAQSVENRQGRRRVRQEARDALGVALFSAAASSALALAILLVVTLVG